MKVRTRTFRTNLKFFDHEWHSLVDIADSNHRSITNQLEVWIHDALKGKCNDEKETEPSAGGVEPKA